MIYISRFFFGISNQIKNFYLNSNIYDKKISKFKYKNLVYKPSPHLLSSIIKYQKKKFKVEDFTPDDIWHNKNICDKDYKNLNNFNWFFSLDLKSSKKTIHKVITNWINNNFKYNKKSWNFDLTAKRIIAWLSCHNLSYDDVNESYKKNFNNIIQKQANHLLNEIYKSKFIEDKLIGCASIILVGLCYQDEKNYLFHGINFLKKFQK